MKPVKIETCPYCGGKDLIGGYGIQSISSSDKIATRRLLGDLEYTVCSDCGSIVHIGAINLEKLIAGNKAAG